MPRPYPLRGVTAWRCRRCVGRRVGAPPSGRPRGSAAAASRRSSRERRVGRCTSSSGPGGDHAALAQQQGVGEARRDLLDVVGDQHGRRRDRVERRAPDSVETRSSRPPRSRPAAGSSSSSSSGSVISARAIWTRLRSPSDRVPKVRSSRRSAPTSASSCVGPVVVEVVVLLAPAADHAVRRGDDDVVDQLVARDPLGQRGAGEADPRAQLEHVDGAEHLAEDPGDPGGRVDLRGGDLQQRGLAGAVGAEDHPALVLLDRPARSRRAGSPRPGAR